MAILSKIVASVALAPLVFAWDTAADFPEAYKYTLKGQFEKKDNNGNFTNQLKPLGLARSGSSQLQIRNELMKDYILLKKEQENIEQQQQEGSNP